MLIFKFKFKEEYMSSQKIGNLFESYFELEKKIFFSHLDSKAVDPVEGYNNAREIINQIEDLLNCQYKEFVFVEIELSDPIWFCDEDDVFPTKVSLDDLKEKIDDIDDMATGRWVNPMLIVVPIEVYKWLDERYDGNISMDLAIYAVAGPCSGYTGNYHQWIQLNKKKYLPKVFKAAKNS